MTFCFLVFFEMTLVNWSSRIDPLYFWGHLIDSRFSYASWIDPLYSWDLLLMRCISVFHELILCIPGIIYWFAVLVCFMNWFSVFLGSSIDLYSCASWIDPLYSWDHLLICIRVLHEFILCIPGIINWFAVLVWFMNWFSEFLSLLMNLWYRTTS